MVGHEVGRFSLPLSAFRHTMMTGTEFQSIIERTGHSLYTLEDRWGVGKSTIHRECQRDEVRGLYEDAARTLLREHEVQATD